MAFRPVPVLHSFVDNLGQPINGGTVSFYDAGTVTPKAVYSDSALTASLGASLTLDAAGRLSVYPWASGGLYIVVRNALGVTVDEVDNVTEEGATGVTFPAQAGNAGKFLTTNGTALSFAPVLQVPDPTGNAGKVLSNDGTVVTWIPKPADGAPATNVTNTATLMKVGTTTLQTGSGSLPASGTTKATVSVTFPTAMVSCSHVDVTMEGSLGTYMVIPKVTSRTGTGFVLEGDTNIYQINFTSAVPFTYSAFGVSA